MPRVPKSCLILGSIGVLLCACVGITCMKLWDSISRSDAFSSVDCLEKNGGSISPHWFEDFAGFTLPASAYNVSASCEAFQDYVAYVRLSIAPNDLNRLVASSFVKTPLSSAEKPLDMTTHYSDMRRIGWNLESISSYLAGEADVTKPLRHQSILIDTRNPSEYIVYVVTFD